MAVKSGDATDGVGGGGARALLDALAYAAICVAMAHFLWLVTFELDTSGLALGAAYSSGGGGGGGDIHGSGAFVAAVEYPHRLALLALVQAQHSPFRARANYSGGIGSAYDIDENSDYNDVLPVALLHVLLPSVLRTAYFPLAREVSYEFWIGYDGNDALYGTAVGRAFVAAAARRYLSVHAPAVADRFFFNFVDVSVVVDGAINDLTADDDGAGATANAVDFDDTATNDDMRGEQDASKPYAKYVTDTRELYHYNLVAYNRLSTRAYDTGAHLFYLVNDNTVFDDAGWVQECVVALQSNALCRGFGVAGVNDVEREIRETRPYITQPCVSRVHLSIFDGKVFWLPGVSTEMAAHAVRWLQTLYVAFDSAYMFGHLEMHHAASYGGGQSAHTIDGYTAALSAAHLADMAPGDDTHSPPRLHRLSDYTSLWAKQPYARDAVMRKLLPHVQSGVARIHAWLMKHRDDCAIDVEVYARTYPLPPDAVANLMFDAHERHLFADIVYAHKHPDRNPFTLDVRQGRRWQQQLEDAAPR